VPADYPAWREQVIILNYDLYKHIEVVTRVLDLTNVVEITNID